MSSVPTYDHPGDLQIDDASRVIGAIKPSADRFFHTEGSKVYSWWVSQLYLQTSRQPFPESRTAVFVGTGYGQLEFHALETLRKSKADMRLYPVFNHVIFIDVYATEEQVQYATELAGKLKLPKAPIFKYFHGPEAWTLAKQYLLETEVKLKSPTLHDRPEVPLINTIAFISGVNTGFMLSGPGGPADMISDDAINKQATFFNTIIDEMLPNQQNIYYVYCYQNDLLGTGTANSFDPTTYKRDVVSLGQVLQTLLKQKELNGANRSLSNLKVKD